MKKQKINKRKKQLILGGGVVLVLLVVIVIVRAVSGMFDKNADISAGLKYIEAEENGDIAKIEQKISLLEKQDNSGSDAKSLKERFTGAVVMGDSITAGFTEYDILNSSSVVAKIGVHLSELDEMIDQVEKLGPQIIFLTLGMNDVTATDGDVDLFVEEYEDVIAQLKKNVPDAHIFVNSIFPVQEKALEEEPAMEKIPEYNEALKKMCDKGQIGFIDSTQLVEEQYYEQDGIHFKADFYPVWAEHMAEVAAL